MPRDSAKESGFNALVKVYKAIILEGLQFSLGEAIKASRHFLMGSAGDEMVKEFVDQIWKTSNQARR